MYIFHCSLRMVNVISPKHVAAYAEEGDCEQAAIGNLTVFYYVHVACFRRVRRNTEKRPLVSSRLSVRPNESARLPKRRLSLKMMLGSFTKICRETSNSIKIEKLYGALYIKTQIFLIMQLIDIRKILQLDNRRKENHFWFSIATISGFLLLIATCFVLTPDVDG